MHEYSSGDLDSQDITCPYCGEIINILVDPSEVGSEYIEDCQVCCQPIEMQVFMDDDQARVIARHQDEG